MKNNILTLLTLFAVKISLAQAIPNTNIKALDNSNVTISEVVNSEGPTLLVFWATWCSHTTEGLTMLQDDYLDDWIDEFNLKIVAVSVDDARNSSKVGPYANGKGWEFDVYMDTNGDLKRDMGINNAPHLFILNSSKEIVWQNNNFVDGDEEIIYQKLTDLN